MTASCRPDPVEQVCFLVFKSFWFYDVTSPSDMISESFLPRLSEEVELMIQENKVMCRKISQGFFPAITRSISIGVNAIS